MLLNLSKPARRNRKSGRTKNLTQQQSQLPAVQYSQLLCVSAEPALRSGCILINFVHMCHINHCITDRFSILAVHAYVYIPTGSCQLSKPCNRNHTAAQQDRPAVLLGSLAMVVLGS